eukprot:136213-Prorocentrum_minimum.AAC.1
MSTPPLVATAPLSSVNEDVSVQPSAETQPKLGNGNLKAKLAMVYLWDRHLAASQQLSVMQGFDLWPYRGGLLAYYPLDEGEGYLAYDLVVGLTVGQYKYRWNGAP